MSLMGVVMMVGIVVSNSILIVEFAQTLRKQGKPVREAIAEACAGPPASRFDDLAGDADRPDSHGAGARARQRSLCAAGSRDHRRPDVSVVVTVYHRAGRVLADVRKTRHGGCARVGQCLGGAAMTQKLLTCAALFILGCSSLRAQSSAAPAQVTLSAGTTQQQDPTPPTAAQSPATTGAKSLTLAEAEAIALKNNPQISVARLEALVAQQNVRIARSAFFPTATLNVTAVGAQQGSRIAAGFLNNPVLYRSRGRRRECERSAHRLWPHCELDR